MTVRLPDFQRPPNLHTPTARAAPGADTGWYRIANTAADVADIWLYDDIGGWGVDVAQFVADLQAITARSINLRINSPGGDAFGGIAIGNAMVAHPAHVTVHVDGLAASAASVIAVMAGNRVVMGRNSQLMIHNASCECWGEAGDLRQMADLLDKVSGSIASAYHDRAGGDLADWVAAMAAETWYTADEAVAAGLADEVAPLTPRDAREPDPVAAWDLSVFRHAGRAAAPAPAVRAPEPVEPVAAFQSATTTTTAGTSALGGVIVTYTAPTNTTTATTSTVTVTAPPVEPATDSTTTPSVSTPDTATLAPTSTPLADATDGAPTQPPTPATGWAGLTAHLTTPTPPGVDALTRLREALQ